ncbi:MAG TPA: XTP/dITP diphosphatase [Pyrodictium sp.]|nr:XTP/dITP diphosphatase [Pyrodictium sp.]
MRVYFATSNVHKIEEARQVAREYGVELVPTQAPKIELQSDSLRDVAVFAAVLAYQHVRAPVIVEDAGLFVVALKGFPGPYSNYVYKTIGVNGLLKLMEGIEDRRAYFLSVVAFAYSEGVKVFYGRVDGEIAHEIRGSKGFGFDPIFIPSGSTRTFAEMDVEEKNRYSHRAQAIRRFCEWLVSKRPSNL